MKENKILIATGIYPPAIGGPSQYAYEIGEAWKKMGHEVCVMNFGALLHFPSGIRHLLYFLRILPHIIKSDSIIALDTWSAALPVALASKICGKDFIIRTGGDFLWESFVERTRKPVLFREFYDVSRKEFNLKEKIIFSLTKFVLRSAKVIAFSTGWQRNIFTKAYDLDAKKTAIVENFYGSKEVFHEPEGKVFLGATRPLAWKNIDTLCTVFEEYVKIPGITLDTMPRPYDEFLEAMRRSYAVILVSLGDISPNMILDAIRLGKPFILTKETGLFEKLQDAALFVDPLDEKEIAEKILWLSNDGNYAMQCERVRSFSFEHSWDEISSELLALMTR